MFLIGAKRLVQRNKMSRDKTMMAPRHATF
jgi:hypothetical protein